MNKTLLLPGIFFSFCIAVSAQKEGQPLADSLEQVVVRTDISEKDRVDILARLSYEYRNLLPRKAIAFGERGYYLIHSQSNFSYVLC